MFSHGLCKWYSQQTLRVLHNSYSSPHWLMLRFLHIWYVGQHVSPFSDLWYIKWTIQLFVIWQVSIKHPVEYITLMESCDMQDSNSISNMFVTLAYQWKWPLQWSLVHQMDHPAVCDMIRGPPSFLLSILHLWKAVICRIPTVHHIYV